MKKYQVALVQVPVVILYSILVSVIYGILHHSITVNVCKAFYVDSQCYKDNMNVSRTMIGNDLENVPNWKLILSWGFYSTWVVGLYMGIGACLFLYSGSQDYLPLLETMWILGSMIPVVLLLSFTFAIPSCLQTRNVKRIHRHCEYVQVAHNFSYLFAIIFFLVGILPWISRRRSQVTQARLSKVPPIIITTAGLHSIHPSPNVTARPRHRA
jgi:hypothetical protein